MAFSFGKPAAPAAGSTGFGFGAASTPAPSTGLGFGAQAAQPATGGLFGAAAAPAAPASGGMFGASAAPAAPAAGGLFGSTAAAPAAGGGLFGSKPAGLTIGTGAAAPAGGGLFGSTAAAPASFSAGGLFGSTAAPAAPAAGGLFGSTAAAPAAGSSLFGAKPAGSGLFGSTPAAQPAAGGGLFGSTAAAPAAGGGLFGSTAAPAQPAAGGLFGSTAAAPAAGGLFGKPAGAAGGLFGQQSTAQPASLQASTAAGPSSGITKATKFSDLPDPIQKTIEQMDSWIKDQKQIGASIDTETVGRAIWQTSGDVKTAADETTAIAQGLASLKQSLAQLDSKLTAEANDLVKFLEIWEASKPADARHPNIRPVAHRDFPQEFFARVAHSLEERVNRYKRNITLLTRAVNSLANEQDTLSPQVVAQTIQNNQQAILSLASQLEGLTLRMNSLRADFTDDYRERTHSMRDPFEIAREEKGLPIVRA